MILYILVLKFLKKKTSIWKMTWSIHIWEMFVKYRIVYLCLNAQQSIWKQKQTIRYEKNPKDQHNHIV